MIFAQFGKNLGSLVEAVNLVGSLFYGSLLGVFVLAFFFKRVSGRGAFWGMMPGRSGHFCGVLLYPDFLPLVQRDRGRGGDPKWNGFGLAAKIGIISKSYRALFSP